MVQSIIAAILFIVFKILIFLDKDDKDVLEETTINSMIPIWKKKNPYLKYIPFLLSVNILED